MGVDKPCRGDHRSSVTTAGDFMVRAVEDVRPYNSVFIYFLPVKRFINDSTVGGDVLDAPFALFL